MASILIIDDRCENRKFLVKLLGYGGHRLLEAGDGLEALGIARQERPDLIIADVLMPTMDGYEFVRRLRGEATIAQTPVIFYTAMFHKRQTIALAKACGVVHVLIKPCKPELILQTVNEALEASTSPMAAAPPERFDQEHVGLLTDVLTHNTKQLEAANLELEAANQRLGALIELGQLLTREHNLTRLLEIFCKRVRELIGASYAAVGILADDGQSLRHFFMAGLDPAGAARMEVPSVRTGPLEMLLSNRNSLHLRHLDLGPQTAALSPEQTPPQSFLSVRIQSCNQVHGLLYLVDKLGAEDFSRSDEQVAVTLASQLAVAYENARLFAQTRQAVQRLSALRAIDLAILSSFDLHITLNMLLEQATPQLRIDAADILLLDAQTQTLECAAIRGFRTTLNDGKRLRLDEGRAIHALLDHGHICIPNLSEQAFVRRPLLAEEEFIAYHAAPLVAKNQVIGVLETFQRTPFRPDAEWLESLDAFAGQAAIAVNSAELFQSLQRSNAELSLAYDATLEGWVRALDLRDKETEGHTQRVTEATLHLAQAMGRDKDELVHIRRGALLHDIGKIGIPDQVLLKPGPLNSEEWEIMRRHPLYAYEWLSPIAYLQKALDIPYCHHEKWDGTGYPRGLKGEQIPLAARMFAIVDVWDALSCQRPYRPAWPQDRVCKHLQAETGHHFDPDIVEAFLSLDRSQWQTAWAKNPETASPRPEDGASCACLPESAGRTRGPGRDAILEREKVWHGEGSGRG